MNENVNIDLEKIRLDKKHESIFYIYGEYIYIYIYSLYGGYMSPSWGSVNPKH